MSAERRHREAVQRGDDYYMDPVTGLLVMTEKYLRDRGECCDSRCRHCPFGDRPFDYSR